MAASSSKVRLRYRITDLPTETLRDVVGHVDKKDLFAMQTVSRQFHALASAEIYRSLDFNIVSTETEDFSVPMSRASDALQTILTSEHDYARHIKSFHLGAIPGGLLSAGSRPRDVLEDQLIMTRLLWDSKADSSKLLNTTILLMTRGASMLETFKWDVPIELSTPVYQALHKLPSLKHLLIRLDIQPAPKLAFRNHPVVHHVPPPPPPGLPPLPTNFPGAAAAAPMPSATVQPFIMGSESMHGKRKKALLPKSGTKRQAFSGFRHLSTLEIVGISNHDCLPEVAQCIKSSSAVLKSLTMTLSSALAKKARNPTSNIAPPILDDDDLSDTELDDDDDELLDPPLPSTSTTAQANNEADVREEKIAQENILATVFDLQSVAHAGRKLEKKLSLSSGKFPDVGDLSTVAARVNGYMRMILDESGRSSKEGQSRKKALELMRDMIDRELKLRPKTSQKPKIAPMKKKSTLWSDSPTSKEISDVLAITKQALAANKSGYKPNTTSNLSNQLNFLSSTNPTGAVNGEMSPSFGTGSISGKSSSYGFPINYYGGPSSSNDMLPPPIPNSSSNIYKPSKAAQSIYAELAGASPSQSMGNSYSYDHSHASSGSHTPTPNSSLWQPYSSNNYPLYSPFSNKSSASVNKHKKTKTQTVAAANLGSAKQPSIDSSDESDVFTQHKPTPSNLMPGSDETPVETMNVDLEHPDEDVSDPGEDQEILPGFEEIETPTPRKLVHPRSPDLSSPDGDLAGETSSSTAVQEAEAASHIEPANTAPSAMEAMQDYVRATHGLQLTELRLAWIPLKASIVGRALDLQVLQRVTLLECGSQDTFWSLLVRLTNPDNPIAFKSIHTDHVSIALINYLGTFEGLEELFLHERNVKNDADQESVVDINRFRKNALRNHMSSLKRLMLRNERNSTWDVDPQFLRFVASKGHKLVELACSMRMSTYHILIQMFTAFPNLHALHVISLRATDRHIGMQFEAIAFALDGLAHCPEVGLRYIACAEQVDVIEARFENSEFSKLAARTDVDDLKGKEKTKGKGKEPIEKEPKASSKLVSDDSSDEDLEDVINWYKFGHKRLHFATSFDAVDDVKIFKKEIRTGRL